MPDEPPDDPLAKFAKDLRDRRGYMQERAPEVSTRERIVHVAIVAAIAVAFLLAKIVSVFSASDAIDGRGSYACAKIRHLTDVCGYAGAVIDKRP